MVSKASDDLPEPESPVITTRESRGSSTSTSLGLCSRAPVTTMEFWREDIRSPLILERRRTSKSNLRSPCKLPGIEQLRLQVVQEWLHAELLPGGATEQLARVELAPVAMDVLAQPLAQSGEAAGRDVGLDVGQLGRERAPQLGGHQVAERVRREVADHPRAPVNVLQDAVEQVRDLEAEQPVRRLVPRLRQVLDLEPALDQRQLQLVAQRDVEVVRRLVGLDPDQAQLDAVDAAVELVGVHRLERLAEMGTQQRQRPLAERPRAADEVLPQPALGLVHAEPGRLRQRGAVVARVHLR